MRAALVGLFAVLAIGCGSPSSHDLCYDSCNVQGRCQTGFTATDVANCKAACDNNNGMLSDNDKACDKMCTNCGTVRSNLAACADKDCSQIATCVNNVDQTCAIRQ